MINDTDKKVIEEYRDELKSMDVPTEEISRSLISIAMNRHVDGVDFQEMGKQMQDMGLPIPFRCQYEVVAGYWQWLKLQMHDTESLFQ